MKNIMKKLTQLLSAGVMAFATIGVTEARPPGKLPVIGQHKAATVKTVEKLKKGDKCAIVCTVCKTMEIKVIQSAEEVAALCHDGGEIECKSCKEKRVIKRIGPPGKQRVVYMNKEGKECMYVFPLHENSAEKK